MQRRSVLLPEPLGPTTTSTSWAATRRSTPRRTGVGPYDLWSPSTTTIGSATGALSLPRRANDSSAGRAARSWPACCASPGRGDPGEEAPVDDHRRPRDERGRRSEE